MSRSPRTRRLRGNPEATPLGDPLSLARLILALNSEGLPWRRIASDLAHELIKTTADRDTLRSGSVAARLTDEERASLAAALDQVGSFKIGDAAPRQLSKIIHALVENLRSRSRATDAHEGHVLEGVHSSDDDLGNGPSLEMTETDLARLKSS